MPFLCPVYINWYIQSWQRLSYNNRHTNPKNTSSSQISANGPSVKKRNERAEKGVYKQMNQQTQDVTHSERKSSVDQAVDTAKQKTAPVKEKAKEVAGDTRSVVDQASHQAKAKIADQKEEASSQLHGLAEALRHTGDQLREQDQRAFASYSNQAAEQIDQVSDYLERRSLNDLMHDAEDFARRQPELFIGGAFTLGLLAARFMKSSAPPGYGRSASTRSGRRETGPVSRTHEEIRESDGQGTHGERPYSSPGQP